MAAAILQGVPVTIVDLDLVHRRSRDSVELRLAEGLAKRFLGLRALIEATERTGRPKDLAALPVLKATLEEMNRRP